MPAEWGGAETHIVGLLPELERLGWTCEVHAPDEAGTSGAPLEEIGVQFRTFRAHYPVLHMSGRERAALVASGGNLVSMDELVHLAANRRASLLHVHTAGRLGGVVRTAARLGRIPYAVTLHGPVHAGGAAIAPPTPDLWRRDVGAPFGWLVGARRVTRDADLLFVLNAAEESAFRPERRGRHLERIVHGVSTTRATESARAEARRHVLGLGDARFALVLGRLDPVKGQDVALEAFARAVPEDLHLVLAGSVTDPGFAAEIRTRACSIPRVHIVQGVPPAVARALLAEATIVLVPSRAEAFGIVLLEAWAEATPALYADVGGLAELGREARDDFGRVATPTPEAFAAALRRALASPAVLAREAARGPERVRPYGWDAVATRVAAAYERAMRGALP